MTHYSFVVQYLTITEVVAQAATPEEALAQVLEPLDEVQRDLVCYCRAGGRGTPWQTAPGMDVERLAYHGNLPPGEVLSARTQAPEPEEEAPRRPRWEKIMTFEVIYQDDDTRITLTSEEDLRVNPLAPTWVIVANKAALDLDLDRIITTHAGHLAHVRRRHWKEGDAGGGMAPVQWLGEIHAMHGAEFEAVTRSRDRHLCQACTDYHT
jgi:hypothetical protein